MREALARRVGARGRYTATVSRFGTKRAYRGPRLTTVLLVDVRDATGHVVTDHLWITVGKTVERLRLASGDTVAFDARVTPYVKGYRGRREDEDRPPMSVDYRLSNPTKLVKRTAVVPPGQATLLE